MKKLFPVSRIEGMALTVLALAAIAICCVIFVAHKPSKYVRGFSGHICYVMGNESKRVKHPVKYASRADCIASLPNKDEK